MKGGEGSRALADASVKNVIYVNTNPKTLRAPLPHCCFKMEKSIKCLKELMNIPP